MKSKLIYIVSNDPTAGVVAEELKRLGYPCEWGPTPPSHAKYIITPKAPEGPAQADLLTATAISQAVFQAREGRMDKLRTPILTLNVMRSKGKELSDLPVVPAPAPKERPASLQGKVRRPPPTEFLSVLQGLQRKADASAPIPVKVAQAPKPPSPPQKATSRTTDLPPEQKPYFTKPWLVVVCVCKTGGEYGPEHVRWLRRQVADKLQTPHQFICLTDKPAECPGGVLLQHDWKGWWSKIELFRPGLFKEDDTVLFLDLDTVLPRPFEVKRMYEPHFCMLESWTDPVTKAWMSGVMLWRGDWSFIYRNFVQHRSALQHYCRGFSGGDQEHIALSLLYREKTIEPVSARLSVGWWNRAEGRPEQDPSTCDVYCWWGSRRPWQYALPWVPPLESGNIVPGLAMIVSWFDGAFQDDENRLRAAQEGFSRLLKLNPKPEKFFLVEGLEERQSSRFPEGAELVKILVQDGNKGLWHKEDLFNIGGRRALESDRISKLLFVDIDTRPAQGEEDWLLLVSDALERCQLLHPWTQTRESQGKEAWISYSAQAALGLKGVFEGQGFAVAMTADWFRACGGFPDGCVTGGGDAVAILRWEMQKIHSRRWYDDCAEARRLVDAYNGPKAEYGYCPGTLIHHYHGPRVGPGETRKYLLRHKIWDWCGGWQEVCQYDSNGLTKWKDTPLARAARAARARLAEVSTEAEYKAIWQEELAKADLGAVFDNIYTSGKWGTPCACSGPGSGPASTNPIIRAISELFEDHNVLDVLDAGCGMNSWLLEAVGEREYTGLDVAPVVIERRQADASEKRRFLLHNIAQDPVPLQADLAVCRDVLTHLPEALVKAVLLHLKAAAPLLLTTWWPGTERNGDIPAGGWQKLNICAAPYNVPAPLRVIDEVDEGKKLALFDLSKWGGVA